MIYYHIIKLFIIKNGIQRRKLRWFVKWLDWYLANILNKKLYSLRRRSARHGINWIRQPEMLLLQFQKWNLINGCRYFHSDNCLCLFYNNFLCLFNYIWCETFMDWLCCPYFISEFCFAWFDYLDDVFEKRLFQIKK